MLLGGSDWESYSLSSDSEDQDDDFSYGDHAQNILSSLAHSIGKIDNFLSFESRFQHGDMVCFTSDPSGQVGKVVGMDVTVDLESLSAGSIKNVNTKDLSKLYSFAVGDYVVTDSWLGRLSKVTHVLTILFDDGAKCNVIADVENFLPTSQNALADAQYPYYPGQRIHIRLPAVLKSSTWLSGTWKANQSEAIVCHVEVGSVYVDWLASVMVCCKGSFSIPDGLQDPKNLTLLSCFPSANWQLSDWCIFPAAVYMDLYKDQNLSNISAQGGLMVNENFEASTGKDLDFQDIFIIVKIKTEVDVIWQDGTLELGLDSHSLAVIDNVGDHDFWPGQFVLEKGIYSDVHSSTGKLGVVKSVDAIQRTVKVKWKIPNLNHVFAEQIVSAYELIAHPDYNYYPGDIVFRILPHHKLESCLPENPNEGQNVKTIGMTSVKTSKEHGLACHCEYKNGYLSCIGNVIGYNGGVIEVKWASGLISTVEPCEVIGIDRYEDVISPAEICEENIEPHQVILDSEEENLEEKDMDEPKKVDESDNEDRMPESGDTYEFSFPSAVFGFLTSLAVRLFCLLGSTAWTGPLKVCSSDNSRHPPPNLEIIGSNTTIEYGSLYGEKMSECQIVDTDKLPPVKHLQILKQTNSGEKTKGINPGNDMSFSIERYGAGQFKRFDTAGDFSDHYFLNVKAIQPMPSQVKGTWLKKLQKEWSLLEKDLPDSIYVRVYEERIDLMRAAVIGAAGTPYHDGLFFFDIFLPPCYPFEPPLVQYNSGGLKLNPNLYESGRICLSLLNTWSGTGSEVWIPDNSTILQVLLSFQALVLNEKPYFNEAGYDKQIGETLGEKNSATYNENAFLLSIKSMLYLMSKPPKSFEALVEEHFRHHSHSIVLACKAYMGGAQVGFAHRDDKIESHSSCSMGFKIMLSKLYPMLISAFIDKGFDCH